ncbi:zinc ribbon domain-containing protein [Paratissierella segnis]|jgi:hypothetical protein|uniref:C4-type zinc ribbon domain-containing protein n=1 Tax=Paratissierella segnis TaxID=2763679 RepID=A0A926EVN7_9FIRM|nr:C4-type zinc ribbon domain-containing protein [Paratissierella segnis]MBC8588362.1 hypothetical protein [Paratissierella segnis]
MSQLDFIWELENHYNALENHKENLDIIKKDLKMKQILEQFNNIKEKVDNLNDRIKSNKSALNRSNRFLNTYDFKIKEIDADLYNGKINDIKQINYLIEEKDKLKIKIEDIETEILTLMEENDSLEEEYIVSTDLLNKIANQIENLKESNSEMQKSLVEKIEYENIQIKSLNEKINKDILNRYQVLKKSKRRGIVTAENFVCGGCNMFVSMYARERLQKKEIVFCESCGRILYLPED